MLTTPLLTANTYVLRFSEYTCTQNLGTATFSGVVFRKTSGIPRNSVPKMEGYSQLFGKFDAQAIILSGNW